MQYRLKRRKKKLQLYKPIHRLKMHIGAIFQYYVEASVVNRLIIMYLVPRLEQAGPMILKRY